MLFLQCLNPSNCLTSFWVKQKLLPILYLCDVSLISLLYPPRLPLHPMLQAYGTFATTEHCDLSTPLCLCTWYFFSLRYPLPSCPHQTPQGLPPVSPSRKSPFSGWVRCPSFVYAFITSHIQHWNHFFQFSWVYSYYYSRGITEMVIPYT